MTYIEQKLRDDYEPEQKDFIGNVIFDNDVVVSADVPAVTGYNRKAVDGSIITVTTGERTEDPTVTGTKMVVKFSWEKWHTVEKLIDLQKRGASSSFWLDGRSGKCVFDQQQGVANVKHSSGEELPVTRVLTTANDIWDGTVTIYVTSGL